MSSMEQPISGLEKTERIPQGTTYVASMGDGSGTKNITQELLTKEVGKGLNLGNLLELMTENKASIVEAINELKGLVDDMDILGTPEEIEANTEEGKAAGALAVKEMVGALNDNLFVSNYKKAKNVQNNNYTAEFDCMVYVGSVTNSVNYGQIITTINNKRIRTFQNQGSQQNLSDGFLLALKNGDMLSVSGDGLKSCTFTVYYNQSAE